MSLAILGIGPLEWLVLLGGAVMLFGDDLPGMARKAARFIGKWRAMIRDLSREMNLHDTPTPPPPLPPALDDVDDWEPDTGADADVRLDDGLGPPGLPPLAEADSGTLDDEGSAEPQPDDPPDGAPHDAPDDDDASDDKAPRPDAR